MFVKQKQLTVPVQPTEQCVVLICVNPEANCTSTSQSFIFAKNISSYAIDHFALHWFKHHFKCPDLTNIDIIKLGTRGGNDIRLIMENEKSNYQTGV